MFETKPGYNILQMLVMLLIASNLKSHSAPSKDNISLKFVKLAKVSYLLILLIYSTKDIFPFHCKAAYVIPISKTLSLKSLDGFRPISLLSVFSYYLKRFWK